MATAAGVFAAVLILVCIFCIPEEGETAKTRVEGLQLLAYRADKTWRQRIIISVWLALFPSGRAFYRSMLAAQARERQLQEVIRNEDQDRGS